MQDNAPATLPLVQWVAQALETIVAALPRLEALADRALFMQLVADAVTRFAEGNRSRFCRDIGLPPLALKNWAIRNERPSLPQWLAIAYGLGIGPVEFLEGVFRHSPESRLLQKLPGKLKQRAEPPELSASQRKEVEAELSRIAAEPAGEISMAMLGRQYQLRRSYLIYRWPEQCQAISRRYKQTVRAKTRLKLAENCKKAEEVVDTLLEKGIYPSARRVKEVLDKLGVPLAEPAIRASYKRCLDLKLQSQNKT